MRIGRAAGSGRDFWAVLPGYGLVLWVLAAIVCALLPLPRWLVDLLLTLSLAGSVTALVASVTARRSAELLGFPRLILLMTLTRMALNVTTTRLILRDADAGEVIAAFSTLVIQGDLLVGAVVFAIVTVVQFVVVARGGERIAEVAARFALDGLPGHQAAIEADLRAGAISAAEASRLRARLRERSNFYGAMDGAAKFIRGDAILGVALTSINVVGGVAVGLRDGLGLAASLELYGRLAIGDGLLAQVPALLVGLAGALLVARVDREEPATRRVAWWSPGLLAAPAGLLAGLALAPGMPAAAFGTTAAGLAALAWWTRRSRGRPGRRIVVCLPGHDEKDMQALRRPLAELRRRCAGALGIEVPPIVPVAGPSFAVRLGERVLSAPEDLGERIGSGARAGDERVAADERAESAASGAARELAARAVSGASREPAARAGEWVAGESSDAGEGAESVASGESSELGARAGRRVSGESSEPGARAERRVFGESSEPGARAERWVAGESSEPGARAERRVSGESSEPGAREERRGSGESSELGASGADGRRRGVQRDMVDWAGLSGHGREDRIVTAVFRAVMRGAEALVDLETIAAALELQRTREPAITREALAAVGPGELLELTRGLLRERVPLPLFAALLEAVASEPLLRQASERGRWLAALRERLAPQWVREVVAAHARVGAVTWTRPVADAEAALMSRAVSGERGLRLGLDARSRQAWRWRIMSQNNVAGGDSEDGPPPIVVCSPRARPVFALLLARGAPHVTVLSTVELQEAELPVPGDLDGPPARWFEAPVHAGGASRGRTLPGERDTA
ncbi:FHIPEP family type III secretion protein [Nannocystis punicea]|uniref:FHIPEP family type III secretion protein n=1 Tax=Nannocystis punicea TaxID=2995304 RepID=A0ABY7H9H3_9BACT|nr:FHIPEP family type III secretion protein [Nannocystis poenicansa]WAS95922.1 FHIPEP family type III secretion protein [Nannocystis poenicansa]